MKEVSVRVMMRGVKSVRFTIASEKQEEVLALLTTPKKGEWVKVDSLRQGQFSFKQQLVAGVQMKPLATLGKKATEGVTLKDIAPLLEKDYYALIRKVNKPVPDSISLKLGKDRRILLTPENLKTLEGMGLTPDLQTRLFEIEKNSFGDKK